MRKSCNVNDYFACETSVYQPDAGCGSYRWNTLELENVLLEAYKWQLLIMRSKLKAVRAHKGSENAVDFVAKIRQVEKEQMVETLTTITNTASVWDEKLRMQMYEDIDLVLVFSNESMEISWKFEDLFAKSFVKESA